MTLDLLALTSCFYDYNSLFGRVTRNAGELPTDIGQFDGFVIPGSKYNATGDEPWIEPLCEVIRLAHAQVRKTPCWPRRWANFSLLYLCF